MKLLPSFLLRVVLTVLVVVAGCVPGLAAIVTNPADNGPGTLRQAILNAAAGEVITFAPALDGQTIALAGTQLLVNKDLTIDASALLGGIVIDAGRGSRVMEVRAGSTVTLNRLTITRGANIAGGGVLSNGDLTLNEASVIDNGAWFGSGISANGGKLTVNNSTFSGNSAISGTIVNTASAGALTVYNSTFSGNAAAVEGGAIINNVDAVVTITHSTIANNTASTAGGGVQINAGTLVVSNSIIANNSAPSGPDIRRIGGTITPTGVNLVSNLADSGLSAGPALLVGDPLLETLGDNGGPTQTMRLQPDSRAIDAAAATGLSIDQRGRARPIDGDGDGTATPDIGAFESSPFVLVTNTDDAGPGSLRDTISAIAPDTIIIFDRTLDGQTITLGGTHLSIDKSLSIDASYLPSGITISGNGSSLVFRVTGSGSTVRMRSLTIRDGRASGLFPRGGGILNDGADVTLIKCTLTNNHATSAGGAINIEAGSVLRAISTTISTNNGFAGGGIRNDGKAVLTNSTLAGNVGRSGSGGAIDNFGALELIHCTLSSNSAASSGGGIHNGSGGNLVGSVNLTSTIIAGNTAAIDADVSGLFTQSGNNLTAGDPMLAPLGNYGGPTATMPPLPGSPAIDTAAPSAISTDQRGVSRDLDGNADGVGAPDIGAAEFNANLRVNTLSGARVSGSLRHAIANLASGGEITFAPALDGQTVNLAGTQLLLGKDVTIDASSLSAGIVLDGGGSSRVMEISDGSAVTLTALTIRGGKAPDGEAGATGSSGFGLGGTGEPGGPGQSGGGILNHGALTLNGVTLSGNAAGNGGAGGAGGPGIFQGDGGNGGAGGSGGALHNSATGTAFLTNCTVAENISGSGGAGGAGRIRGAGGNAGAGGGIMNLGTLTVTHATVARNTASSGGSGSIPGEAGTGGGIANSGSLALSNSILALNTETDLTGSAPTGNGVNLIGGDPLLASLGDYGGPTQTMRPLPGSPAIDAATTGVPADQRGTSRPIDGDNDGTPAPDIGAVESYPYVAVTNSADSGPGSLRDAIATSLPRSLLFFDSALDGQTITLGGTSLLIDKDLEIDGSDLLQRVVLDAGGTSRIFVINAGSTVTLTGMAIRGGKAPDGADGATGIDATFSTQGGGPGGPGLPGSHGGGILNHGTLTLRDVTLTGNTAGDGGRGGDGGSGQFSIPGGGTASGPPGRPGAGAPGGSGGALFNSGTGTILIDSCTLTNNAGGDGGDGGTGSAIPTAADGGGGGGIANSGELTITRTTIAQNNTGAPGIGGNLVLPGSGGGVQNTGTGTLDLTESAITANTAGLGGGIWSSGAAKITQSTITANATNNNANGGRGGGVHTSGAAMLVDQCTIANNTTNAGTGAGLYATSQSAETTIRNSIIANNTGGSLPHFGADGGTVIVLGGVNLLWPIAVTPPVVGDAPLIGDPLLSPLGDYGGPTQTMYPLPGSAAIDAGGATSLSSDQRGRPRLADGDSDGTAASDIGAYEVGNSVVTTVADSGPGSLRSLVDAHFGHEWIRFNTEPSMGDVFDGSPAAAINLSSPLSVTGDALHFDASNIPGGVTISGNDTSQIMIIASEAIVEIDSMTITKGRGQEGGAIVNEGALTLNRSTLSDNSATNLAPTSVGGGGILNFGTLTFNHGTLSGNSATNGGGISNINIGTLTLNHSTLSANSASGYGGGIFNYGGELTLNHSTLSANSASEAGGGIVNAGTLKITHSIVAGNTAPTDANLAGTMTAGSNNLFDDDPRLAPLGDYGGPTQTMPLLVGSPAIDAGVSGGSTPATDQRGFLRVVGAAPDIGALEAGPTILVSSTGDRGGASSLRTAISNATSPGTRILFNLSSRYNVILLEGSEITIDNGRTVFLDASSLVDAAGNVRMENDPVRPGEVIFPRGVAVAQQGGGSRVFKINSGGNAAMHGVEISGGSATTDSGGGILNQGVLTLNESTVTNNDASSGGGIATEGESLALNNSTIANNRASESGGGLYKAQDGTLTINSSTFAGNSADASGGGLFLDQSGSNKIASSTIAGNSASGGSGGGIRLNSGTLVLTNSIVGDNSAGVAGPDLAAAGTVVSSGVNLLRDPTGSGLSAGTGVIVGAPFLSALADHGGPTMTMALLGNSPAIDTGVAVGPLPFTDQRGYPRLLANGLDIGAFESAAGDFNASGLTLYAKVPEAVRNGGTLRFEISTNRDFLSEVLTIAGTGAVGAVNGPAGNSQFSYPSDVVQDRFGNRFIADSGNNMIRMISEEGVVTTIAGTGSFGFANGDGDEATFAFPSALAIGPDDNLYVADTLNHVIRKLIRPQVVGLPWTVTTVAGYGFAGFLDGIGTNSLFNHPHGITIDRATGDLYVADTFNQRIRKITPAGVVSTWAGSGATGNTDGYRLVARFSSPFGVVADSAGNLFVSDRGKHSIRRVDAEREEVTTIAGGSTGVKTDNDIGLLARFKDPAGLAIDSDDNLVVADEGNHAIRKVAKVAPWKVTTVAGTGTGGFLDGLTGAPGAQFNHPTGVFVAANGDILVADEQNHRIRRIVDPLSVDALLFGQDAYGHQFSAVIDINELDLAPETPYYFRWVAGLETQMVGQSFTIFSLPTVVTTPASNLTRTSATINATVDPHGSPTAVTFDYSTDPDLAGPWAVGTLPPGLDDPQGVAVDKLGNIYVADSNAHKILRIDSGGAVSDFAGSGTAGFADGPGASAQFDHPVDLAIDAAGNLYVADELNHRIRKITPAGVVTTIAGSGDAGFANAPVATNGQFIFPCGVAVNAAGTRIIVADRGNQRIRLISGGALNSLAGNGTAGFANGAAATARFNNPTAVALDALGNVYVADRDNHRIRLVTPNGQVTTFAGSGGNGYLDGPGASAQFAFPSGVAIDGKGGLYVTDSGNHRVRSINGFSLVTTMAGSGLDEIRDTSAAGFLYPATAAAFSRPNRVAVGSDGALFLTEQGGSGIRKISRMPLPSITLPQTYDTRGPLDLGTAIPETLMLGTTYYFRARAENSVGPVAGAILSFTTPLYQSIAVFAGPDTAAALLAAGQSEAIDLGITPRGTPVIRPFTITNVGEWDLTVTSLTPPAGYLLTGGTGIIAPGASLTFDLSLTATAGGAFGGDLEILSDDPEVGRFAFPVTGVVLDPPAVTTQDATDLGAAAATLNASINPEDSATTVWFAYSEDPELDAVHVSTLAGSTPGDAEGTGPGARFDQPSGIATDEAGNIYIADTQNHRIRRIAPDGTSSPIAGTGVAGFANGPAAEAQFNEPVGVVLDSAGTLFVTDSKNHRIRAISPTGVVTTHSGLGSAGFTNGAGVAARFNLPAGLAIDVSGVLYVADRLNHRIRKVAPDGTASTLAGTGTAGYLDGAGNAARFNGPLGIVVGGSGRVHVTEAGSHAIRRIEPDGTVSTLAGSATPGFADAVGTAARFSSPAGLALDASGQLLVADRGNHRIRSVTADGSVSTLAGSGTPGGLDGLGDDAKFDDPASLAAGPQGELFVGDLTNSTIRRIISATTVVQVASGLTGIADEKVALPLTGIDPGTTYYFRAIATNGGGTTYGEIKSFSLLIPPPLPPFQVWQIAKFGPDAGDPLIAGPLADPSADGVPNLQKYAFLLDPHVNSRDGLPTTEWNGTSFTITYTKVLAAGDLVYTVQWSTDLRTWSSAGITEEILADDGVTQLVRASASSGTATRKFFRIALTLQ